MHSFSLACLSIILILLAGNSLAIASEGIESTLSYTDSLIDKHDNTGLEEPLLEAVNILEGLMEKYPQNPHLLWRTAEAHYYLGFLSEDNLGVWEKGKDLAKKVLEIDPENPKAHFWYASLLGQIGLEKGVFNSLFSLKPMKEHLEKAIKLDPNQAVFYYVLGRLYLEAPGWPVSFGNKEMGVKYLEKAVAIDPTDQEFLIHLYQAYISMKRTEDAQKVQEMIAELN
jgi:tetratricopeptide (TPR) repeat protein